MSAWGWCQPVQRKWMMISKQALVVLATPTLRRTHNEYPIPLAHLPGHTLHFDQCLLGVNQTMPRLGVSNIHAFLYIPDLRVVFQHPGRRCKEVRQSTRPRAGLGGVSLDVLRLGLETAH